MSNIPLLSRRNGELNVALNENIRHITLSWSNINVKVKKNTRTSFLSYLLPCQVHTSEEVLILDNVSGKAASGSLIAVMGTSGSGKTTLLSVISKRKERGVTGSIFLNSQIVNRDVLLDKSGYVLQKDICIATLTAMEHLLFVSRMKLCTFMTLKERRTKVSSLLAELGLSEQENIQITNLSGGQRKRLSIAAELLHNPEILFCDEPTTGLDSYNAMLIVEKLQKMAKLGKTVITSIHQPSSEVFCCFDQLILLSNGKLAYHGPTNSVLRYFQSLGQHCPSNYNPADFLIKKFTIVPGNEDTCEKRIKYFCQKFSESYLQDSIECDAVSRHQNFDEFKQSNTKNSQWLIKLYWLMWRSAVDSSRTKLGHLQQVAVFLVTSFMLAIFYSNISNYTQQGIQDVHGLLYLISSEVYFTSTYRVLNTFPQEIAVFLKEKDLYPISAFYISKVTTMIPRTLIEPAIFLAIICVIHMLNGCEVLSYFALIVPLLVSACAALAYGCALSAVFQSADIASVVSVPVDLVALLMAGMFFNIRSLPSAISWIKYLSQLHYTNEALIVLHWQDVTVIECPLDISLPCIKNGTQVMENYGYAASNVPEDVVGLIIMFFVLNLIGWLGLYRQAMKNDSS